MPGAPVVPPAVARAPADCPISAGGAGDAGATAPSDAAQAVVAPTRMAARASGTLVGIRCADICLATLCEGDEVAGHPRREFYEAEDRRWPAPEIMAGPVGSVGPWRFRGGR